MIIALQNFIIVSDKNMYLLNYHQLTQYKDIIVHPPLPGRK